MKFSIGILSIILLLGIGAYLFQIEKSNGKIISIATTLETIPKTLSAGIPAKLHIKFEDKKEPFQDLHKDHGRILHALIISENFDIFAHLHPEDFAIITEDTKKNGVYSLDFTFPRAGNYMLSINTQSEFGEIHKNFLVTVAGSPTMEPLGDPDFQKETCVRGYTEEGPDRYIHPILYNDAQEDCTEEYTISLTTESPLVSGKPTTLTYEITQNGSLVKDLNPFLGTAAHIVIIPESFDEVFHIHGIAENRHLNHENDEVKPGEESEIPEEESLDELEKELQGLENLEGELEMLRIPIPIAYAHDEEIPEETLSTSTFGPVIQSEPFIFPKSGIYYVWAQMKHQKNIINSRFILNIE